MIKLNRKIAYTFAFLLALAVMVFVFLFENMKNEPSKFLKTINQVGSINPDYLMICEISYSKLSQKCDISDVANNSRLKSYVLAAKEAKTILVGKGTVVQERILRIGRGDPVAKQYIGCFRLIQYKEFKEVEKIFLNEVVMDPECTRVVRYDPGYVVLSNSRKWLLEPH